MHQVQAGPSSIPNRALNHLPCLCHAVLFMVRMRSHRKWLRGAYYNQQEPGGFSLTEPSRAVFLSYASQDASAAQRICDALRASGIEVWFDKSELRGGDAWDQSIRRQIKNCALLIPVISHHTHERAEGYFRLEWKLAVDRSHLIMANKAFLLPVVIDDTGDDDENVPDKFREVQWTRLPSGETSPVFVERVQRLLSGETAPSREAAEATGRASAPLSLRRRRPGAWYAVGAVAVLVGVGYFGFGRWLQHGSGAPSAASIAVLPLANESGEASQQYFSDGISEDLITALGQFQGLKVIGRASAFKFRNSREDSRSIGEQLGVAHLLEGSVRKAGDMIRVSAELINAADGTMQWSEHYDRPYKDLFALQDEITTAVAQALKTRLLPSQHAAEQSERPPSGSIEAYNALLEGRFYASRGAEADDRKALEFFMQATQRDPSYALAWAQLASQWTIISASFLSGGPAQEAYVKARDAVTRALALSPDLAAAHSARGLLLQLADYDFRGADAEFRRAVALAPNNAVAQLSLGQSRATFGDVDRAIALTRQAIAIEPLRGSFYQWLGVYFSGLHRLDEAERAIRKAIDLQPGGIDLHQWLAIIEVQRGNAQAALAAAEQEPAGMWQDVAIAIARQIGPDRGAADAALKTLIDRDAEGAPYQIAEVYALRKDAKATFEWLDRAWNSRDSAVTLILFDPFILHYKNDARFAAFCHKVGLPAPGADSTRSSTAPGESRGTS
jgi:TolB-like protein/Flp pilus assembly protein TadD